MKPTKDVEYRLSAIDHWLCQLFETPSGESSPSERPFPKRALRKGIEDKADIKAGSSSQSRFGTGAPARQNLEKRNFTLETPSALFNSSKPSAFVLVGKMGNQLPKLYTTMARIKPF